MLNTTFKDATKVNLKGVAIGDGWTDPANQFNYYDSLLYSAGIVSNKFRDVGTWFQTQGIVNILKGNFVNVINILLRLQLTLTTSPMMTI